MAGVFRRRWRQPPKTPWIGSAVVAGPQTVTGVLFTRSPAFITGAVTTTVDVDGVLFTRPPAFIAGTITPTYALTGVLFTRPPLS